MDIVNSVTALRERLQREPNNVFVPTMGNLHEGHIDLIRIGKPKAACTVVSIFVNRLQFGPKEDFERYPRTFQSDCDKLRSAGVDVVFAPDEKEIYPEPQTFVVEPSDLQHILDGAFRPGHFRGVATVVLKLFNMVMPHAAIFGKKDYQQYLVLRDMVRQFALPVEIIPAETVRAADGLALSSRNGYLCARPSAPKHRACTRCSGARAKASPKASAISSASSSKPCRCCRKTAGRRSTSRCAAARTCRRPRPRSSELVVLAAAYLGKTRLIDNIEVTL